MTTVYDVPPAKLVKAVGEKLKKNKAITRPKWGLEVKRGANAKLPPENEDWWWVRCASVLRQIYLHGPVGVARLRTYYGGRVRRGTRREHFREASGKIIREVLAQLERAGYVTKTKRGRKISPEGQQFLDNTAHELKPVQPGSSKGT